MRDVYTVKYRKPGQIFFRKVKLVIGDGVGEHCAFRYLLLEDDTLIHLPIDTEIIFPPIRSKLIEKKMSKEAGTPVQRA